MKIGNRQGRVGLMSFGMIWKGVGGASGEMATLSDGTGAVVVGVLHQEGLRQQVDELSNSGFMCCGEGSHRRARTGVC